MEISLVGKWSIEVGPLASHTLDLLPSSSQKTSKVVVADKSGALSCIDFKRSKPVVVFKTPDGPEANRLFVVDSRIFFAASNEVKGYKKSARNFYNISTFMTEPILSLYIYDNQLHLAGEHVYSHYIANKEQPFYVCSDRIVDLVGVRVPGGPKGWMTAGNIPDDDVPYPLLACGDRALRFTQGKKVVYEASLSSRPTCLCPVPCAPGTVLYGTSCGRIGAVQFSSTGHTMLWMLENPRDLGSVTCVGVCDIASGTNNGCDVLVGRECGTVEVYTADEPAEVPVKAAHTKEASAIVALVAGLVSSATVVDVVVATYAGLVRGYTTTDAVDETPTTTHALYKERLRLLTADIDDLKLAEANQAAQVQKLVASVQGTQADKTTLAKSTVLPSVDVRDSFVLNERDASYMLTIELPVSLDMVVLTADVPAGVVDTDDTNATARATIGGVSDVADASDINNHTPLRLTYECRPGTTRFQVRVRTTEGEYGCLQVSIFPHVTPKVCCRRQYVIPALSLHHRLAGEVDATALVNCLTLSGKFASADMHAWLGQCFAGMPGRTTSETNKILFRSAYVGSHVDCEYSEEQQYVVQHAEEITAAYELEPFHVTRLHGIVERLFVDFHAFKGQDVASKLGDLSAVWQNHADVQVLLSALAEFFQP